MRRNLYYLIIFLFGATLGLNPCFAQSGYGKIIDDINGEIRNLNIDDIIYHNDHLYIRGNKFIDSIGLWGLFVAKLDTNGVLLSQKIIYDTTKQSSYSVNTPTRFSITETGDLVLPNKYFHLNKLALSIIDSSGNEVFTKGYNHNGKTIYPKEVILFDNFYYMFGRVQRNDFEGDCYILKADKEGSLVWLKYYGIQDHEEGFGGAILNQDGTFTISSFRVSEKYYISGSTIIGWKSPWIFTVDTSGLIVDEWLGQENDPSTLGGGTIKKGSDEDWIITSADLGVGLYMGVYEIWVSPTISRLDSNFNLMWKRNVLGFENRVTYLKDMEYDAQRDEIVACGHKKIAYNDSISGWEIWVIKLNGDGEVLWDITDTIKYPSSGGHVEAGLEIAPSGSIYVAGYESHLGVSQGWILKVTPDGCSDTLCTTTSLEEQIRNWKKNVVVYPNPTSSTLNVTIESLKGEAWLQLFDLNGRRLLKDKVVEGNNRIELDAPPGVYISNISDGNRILHAEKLVIIK